MKKFFKNPYIIAWIGVLVLILIIAALSPLASWLIHASVFLIGVEFIYSGVLLALHQKKRNKVDITEFMNDDEKEIKKTNMAQKEAKMNKNIIIFFLVMMGVFMMYFTFRGL